MAITSICLYASNSEEPAQIFFLMDSAMQN